MLAKALIQGARGKGAPQDPLRWRARRGRLDPSTRPLKSTEGSGLLPGPSLFGRTLLPGYLRQVAEER